MNGRRALADLLERAGRQRRGLCRRRRDCRSGRARCRLSLPIDLRLVLDRRGAGGHRRRAAVPHPHRLRSRPGAPRGRLARRAASTDEARVSSDATLRLEDFIQAVQSQLDNAQTAMAIKARNLNLPLTFAIKDINLDLRAHVEFADSEIRIRPAARRREGGQRLPPRLHRDHPAGDRGERDQPSPTDPDDQPLDELGDELTDGRAQAARMGGRAHRQAVPARPRSAARSHTIGRVTNLPVERLRKALERASTPLVQRVEPVAARADGDGDEPPLLRVTGRNLVRGGAFPQVRIGDRPVSILKSAPDELLLAPDDDQWAGELSLESAPTLADRDELRPRRLRRRRPQGAADARPVAARTGIAAYRRRRGDDDPPARHALGRARRSAVQPADQPDGQARAGRGARARPGRARRRARCAAGGDARSTAAPSTASSASRPAAFRAAQAVQRGRAVRAGRAAATSATTPSSRRRGVARTLILRVPSGTPVGPLCETLAQITTVESASPNYVSVTPFDCRPAGRRAEAATTAGPRGGWCAWPRRTRIEPGDDGVVVGLVDSGISTRHPEFARTLPRRLRHRAARDARTSRRASSCSATTAATTAIPRTTSSATAWAAPASSRLGVARCRAGSAAPAGSSRCARSPRRGCRARPRPSGSARSATSTWR